MRVDRLRGEVGGGGGAGNLEFFGPQMSGIRTLAAGVIALHNLVKHPKKKYVAPENREVRNIFLGKKYLNSFIQTRIRNPESLFRDPGWKNSDPG